jgi:hypothetical protein
MRICSGCGPIGSGKLSLHPTPGEHPRWHQGFAFEQPILVGRHIQAGKERPTVSANRGRIAGIGVEAVPEIDGPRAAWVAVTHQIRDPQNTPQVLSSSFATEIPHQHCIAGREPFQVIRHLIRIAVHRFLSRLLRLAAIPFHGRQRQRRYNPEPVANRIFELFSTGIIREPDRVELRFAKHAQWCSGVPNRQHEERLFIDEDLPFDELYWQPFLPSSGSGHSS